MTVIDDPRQAVDNSDLLAGIKLIDVDSHLSEPHDLWTNRAPAKYRDLVPQVKERNGRRVWVVDGDIPIGGLGAASVVAPDGGKMLGTGFIRLDIDMVHAASHDPVARVEMLDVLGLHAQVMYPNLAGFGNQNFMKVADADLRLACVQIYNDAMIEMQQISGNRLLPMALMPWWDIDASVAETIRCHEAGLRGVVTCSNPQDADLPDLGTDAWDPFWEACIATEMPVNFHIGSSARDMDWFGQVPWPSFNGEQKLSVGSANIFMGNAKVIGNLIFAGVPERFPALKFVSVESGVGWIPFFLEALDYQMSETGPNLRDKVPLAPSEYFRRNFFGCFWFEKQSLAHVIDTIGVQSIMFETDFPHPTCLYPKSDERVRDAISGLDFETRKAILSDNAAKLYKVDV
ncbi:MAG: amidohydrolase [Acidimicrobiia bacterium]|nr:amidohydrolase [Acidimicrobiia bacterium]